MAISYKESVYGTTPSSYIDEYAPESELTINMNSRKVLIPPELKTIGLVSDNNSETVVIRIPSTFFDEVSLIDKVAYISYINAGDKEGRYDIIQREVDGDTIRLFWTIDNKVTKYAGIVKFQVVFELDDNYKWSSQVAKIKVRKGLKDKNIEDDVQGDESEVTPSIVEQINDTFTDIRASISSLNNLISKKVDMADGKDLSSNDFTDAYKSQIEAMYGDVGSIDIIEVDINNNSCGYTLESKCPSVFIIRNNTNSWISKIVIGGTYRLQSFIPAKQSRLCAIGYEPYTDETEGTVEDGYIDVLSYKFLLELMEDGTDVPNEYKEKIASLEQEVNKINSELITAVNNDEFEDIDIENGQYDEIKAIIQEEIDKWSDSHKESIEDELEELLKILLRGDEIGELTVVDNSFVGDKFNQVVPNEQVGAIFKITNNTNTNLSFLNTNDIYGYNISSAIPPNGTAICRIDQVSSGGAEPVNGLIRVAIELNY